MIIKVKTVEGVKLPSYATTGSSGMDIEANEDTFIPSMSWRPIHTGLHFEVPNNYEIQIRSRGE